MHSLKRLKLITFWAQGDGSIEAQFVLVIHYTYVAEQITINQDTHPYHYIQ